jgi:NTE family protein
MGIICFLSGCVRGLCLRKKIINFYSGLFIIFVLMSGCAHYPVNPSLDQYSPDKGYRIKNMGSPNNSDKVLFVLTFSGGGTRAAALSYGVLEALAETEVTRYGRTRRLLDEVDIISGVSGGSFTAAYYGLFGDRIFEDYESRVLRKDIQGELLARKFLFIPNWFRLFSPHFDASDMAAEYYDKYIFEGGTFGDILARGGPAIIINATDMTEGTTFAFVQDYFDLICSDVSEYPVARGTAASSAVPVVLSPVSLRNYTGECDYNPEWISEALKERETFPRRYYQAIHADPYLDPEKKRYVHLVDGGIADNLGLRIGINRIIQHGNFWSSLKHADLENTHKVIFLVVNAQTGIDKSPDLMKGPPGTLSVLSSVTTTPMNKYSFESIELLKSHFKKWGKEVRTGRCSDPGYKGDTTCDDIEFYLVHINFDNIPNEEEREYFKSLPTTFNLDDKTVDDLREIAGRLLNQTEMYRKLTEDVK